MSKKRRSCIISPEVEGPHKNGGVGTHSYYLAAFLSQQLRQDVTMVFTGAIDYKDEAYWQEAFRKELGVQFVWLGPPERCLDMPMPLQNSYLPVTRKLYSWLREQPFDVCHFQDMLGGGFACFQAKRMGLAFQNTVLTCTVHSSWEWLRQAMQIFPEYGSEEMQTKFMERYCVANCDLLVSPSQYMFDWIHQNRVPACPRQTMLPYLYDPKLQPVGYRPTNRHLVFFGRLEVRKGLLVFLEALQELDARGVFQGAPMRITFLGKSGYTPHGGGQQSIEQVQSRLSPQVQIEILTELGHQEAMEFLIQHNDALVVAPSLVDNSPFAIIESLQMGLNIIAARTGGIPELFQGNERLFEPNALDLAARIESGLANELPPTTKRYSNQRAAEMWQEFCEKTVPAFQASNSRPAERRSVSVQVFANATGTPEAIEKTVHSLESQTSLNGSVAMVKERDNLPDVIRQRCKARGWRVICGADGSDESAELTRIDPKAEYAVFLGAGAVLKPEALQRLTECMEFSGADLLTCHAEIEPEQGSTPAYYQPLGPCLEGGFLNNFFGGGCVIFKKSHLPTELSQLRRLLAPHGVWAFCAEQAVKGKVCDVVPEALIAAPSPACPLSSANLSYNSHMDVIDAYSKDLPIWLHYTLVNGVEADRQVQSRQKEFLAWQQLAMQTDRLFKQTQRDLEARNDELRKLRRTTLVGLAFIVKREVQRVLNQWRSLFR